VTTTACSRRRISDPVPQRGPGQRTDSDWDRHPVVTGGWVKSRLLLLIPLVVIIVVLVIMAVIGNSVPGGAP
jgi:hypothetical protein